MTRAADFGTASLLIDSFPGARLEPLSFLKRWSGLGKKEHTVAFVFLRVQSACSFCEA